MATTFNAFDLLSGKVEQEQASSKKKNKKTKNKGEDNSSKGVAEAVATSHGSKTVPAAQGQNLVVSSDEMIAILEKTSRSSTSGSDRVRLWKEWCRQASDKSDKAVQYKNPDGSSADFTQLFIRSKALEITAETCVTNPVSQQQQPYLLQLLSTFLPNDGGKSANALTGALTRLAELLANDGPDTIGAAQRAVQQVVHQLKSSRTEQSSEAEAGQVGQWLTRLQVLDKDMSTEQTLMQKLAQASANAVTRERIQSARKILRLQEKKMDLLQPGSIPNVGAGSNTNSPSILAVKELQSVVYHHLKDAEALEDNARGKVASADAQKKQARVAYNREDTILAKQGSEIAAQIRTLEAQMQTLRMQATEIEQKRSRLQLLQKDAAAASSNGATHYHQQAGLTSAQYQQQLATVDTLLDLLDPHRHSAATMEQVWAAQATQPNAAADYFSLAHHYLTMNLSFLAEMPQKVSFSKQRIAQAEKLIKLTAGNAKSLETNKKQKEDAEKLLTDTMKAAEDALMQSEEVYKSVLSRHHLLAQQDLALASSLAPQVAAVEELFQRSGGQYANVMTSFDQVPAPILPQKAPAPARKQQVQQPAQTEAPAPIPTPVPTATPVEQPKFKPVHSNGTAASPPRHWAKVQASQPEEDGNASLPTPAEAFRSSAEHSDGFRPVGSSRRNKKA